MHPFLRSYIFFLQLRKELHKAAPYIHSFFYSQLLYMPDISVILCDRTV